MNVKRLRRLVVAKKVLRISGISLAVCGLIIILCLGVAKAAIPTVPPDSTERQMTPPSSQLGYKYTKNGGVKVKAITSSGKVVQKRFRFFQDYTWYDSVLILQGNKKCYLYSYKTGALSKPYLDLGTFKSKQGKHLLACVDKNKKIGFVDCRTCEEVIPCQFYYNEDVYYEDYPFRDYSPCFDNNRCNLQLSPECDGIIDTMGKVLIKGRNIYEPDNYDGYIVEEKGSMSLYTKDLQCVLADKERITSFRVGIVYKDSLSDNLMLIRSGCSESTPVYTLFDIAECESVSEVVRHLGSKPTDEYYTFDISYELGAGVIDRDMNLVVDPKWKWDRVVTLGNGYIICFSEGVGFLMDKNGNFVIPNVGSSSPTEP